MAIFKIKDGFSIVDSNNVESQQISGIATAISNNPSHTKVPTEKAVADAIAAGGGGGDIGAGWWEPEPISTSFIMTTGATSIGFCKRLLPGVKVKKVRMLPLLDNNSSNNRVPTICDFRIYKCANALAQSAVFNQVRTESVTGAYNGGYFEMTTGNSAYEIPNDGAWYSIAILINSFFRSGFSTNINVVGSQPFGVGSNSTIGSATTNIFNTNNAMSYIRCYLNSSTKTALPSQLDGYKLWNDMSLPWIAISGA